MRLTIGLPVYQGERYLEQALRSLLEQTYSDFTLLVSDNTSTDDTPRIVQQFDDPRIRYVRQETNIGAAGNFEYVLHAAETPLFMWAAHDDVWAPTFLETCVGLLDANPAAIGGMTAAEVVDENDDTLWVSRMPGIGDESMFRRALAGDEVNAIYAVFRRSVLLDVTMEHIYGADRAIMFQLMFRGPIACSDEVLRTQRFVGYEMVEHAGRFLSKRATGPDGYLHSPDPGPMVRTMFAQIADSPLSPLEKTRLRAHLLRRQWWRWKRNDWLSDGPYRIRRALAEHHYVRAGLLGARHAVLNPRSVAPRKRPPREAPIPWPPGMVSNAILRERDERPD